MTISYHGRVFRSVSGTGEVDEDTRFHYAQDGDLVFATYTGGAIRLGSLIAIADPGGNLEMRYQHLNRDGFLMTGVCRTRPELLPDGRLRLHETWQWTSGDGAAGTSVLEEVR